MVDVPLVLIGIGFLAVFSGIAKIVHRSCCPLEEED